MKKKLKGRRLREITAVFIRHGVAKGVKGSIAPANIRAAFEELGPTFVKIGQLLSTRPDLMPPEYIEEFKKLQDDVRPEKPEDIKAVVEESLKSPIERLFSSFEEKAAASASVAEVHRAVLPGGEDVVVKVRRPGVRDTILEDIGILRFLFRSKRLSSLFSFVNVRGILDELERNARLELDFSNEAANIKKFRENNADVKCVTAPRVFDDYTTEQTIVMEYIDGIKINDAAALDAEGFDRDDIGRKLANNYVKQIFGDGFFHADPHPGNLMVSGNKIVYLDFGLMGTLDPVTLKKLNGVISGCASGDADELTRSVLSLVTPSGPVDRTKLYSDIAAIYGRYASARFEDIETSELVNAIFGACARNNIVIPRELTMLGKGLIGIESVLAELSPGINTMSIVVGYAARRFASPEELRGRAAEFLKDAYRFPALVLENSKKLSRLLDAAEAGRLTVNIDNPKQEKLTETVNRMVNRIVFGLVIAALIIGSSVILSSGATPAVTALGVAGYIGAALLGFWLLISIIRSNRL